MIILLSPSKTLSKREAPEVDSTQPKYLEDAELLVETINRLDNNLGKTLGVNEKLAALNKQRFEDWSAVGHSGGKPALYAYAGDVYNGVAAFDMTDEEISYAQSHLRILSGLYGCLRPLDLILPYRLEMSTRLKGKWGINLYEFWGDRLAKDITTESGGVILNCASDEYFKVVKKYLSPEIRVITPKFLHDSGDGPKAKMLFAKYMRGVTARWAIENRVTNADQVKTMNYEGYTYSASLSSDDEPTFLAPKEFSLLGRFVNF